MQACLGIAEVAHHVDQIDKFGSLKGKYPFVVVQTESCHSVREYLREVDSLHTVVLEHFGAAFGIHVIPVVGTHEGVNAYPCLGCLLARIGGCMVAGEFCLAMHTHSRPDDGGRAEERSTANLAHGCLQLFGGRPVGPHHNVCVIAHSGNIVESAQRYAVRFELFDELLELCDSFRRGCALGTLPGTGEDGV